MARNKKVDIIPLIWHRMNYAQKRALFRLATGVSAFQSERTLNLWWSSLSEYEHCLILDSLMEFLNEKAN